MDDEIEARMIYHQVMAVTNVSLVMITALATEILILVLLPVSQKEMMAAGSQKSEILDQVGMPNGTPRARLNSTIVIILMLLGVESVPTRDRRTPAIEEGEEAVVRVLTEAVVVVGVQVMLLGVLLLATRVLMTMVQAILTAPMTHSMEAVPQKWL